METSDEALRRIADVNILGVLFCIKACLPSMIHANHGHILVTSSIKAYVTVTGSATYAGSKAAITSVVEGLQTELKHNYGNPRIKVSAICPTMVNTCMGRDIHEKINIPLLPVASSTEVAERMIRILQNGER